MSNTPAREQYAIKGSQLEPAENLANVIIIGIEDGLKTVQVPALDFVGIDVVAGIAAEIAAGNIVSTAPQELSTEQKAQVRANVGLESIQSSVGGVTVTGSGDGIARLTLANDEVTWSVINYGNQFAPNGSFNIGNDTDELTALTLTREGKLTVPAMHLVATPSIEATWLGLPQNFTALMEVTATQAAKAEGVAHFAMTSDAGIANPYSAYKTALSATMISNPGSADAWAQSNIMTIMNGGPRRGGITLELDLNNFWGDYDTFDVTPGYAANLFLTGMNSDGVTGGVSQAAIMIEQNQNANPMWEVGIAFGPGGHNPFRTAAMWDRSYSPTSYKITGSHGIGIDMSEAYFGLYAISTPGFDVDGNGQVTALAVGAGGVGPTGILSPVHAYTDDGGFEILARLENNNGAGGTIAALGFSATSTVGGETRSAKAGLFFERGAPNGCGTFGLANRIVTDTADFGTGDVVLQWDTANACKMKIAGTLYTLSVSGGAVQATP